MATRRKIRMWQGGYKAGWVSDNLVVLTVGVSFGVNALGDFIYL